MSVAKRNGVVEAGAGVTRKTTGPSGTAIALWSGVVSLLFDTQSGDTHWDLAFKMADNHSRRMRDAG